MNAERLEALITILDSGKYIVDVKKGEIRSKKRPHFGVLGYVDKKTGYVLICFGHKGLRFLYRVHEVIVVAAGLNLLGLTVNHKSGNKEDNRIKNLEVMTSRDNTKHAWDTGLNVRGNSKKGKLKKQTKKGCQRNSSSKPKKQRKSKAKSA